MTQIVYHLEDEFKRLLLSLLPIERYLVSHGTAKVLKVFQLSGKEEAVVAGLRVETGTLKMPSTGIDYEYRVLREGKILAEGLKVSKLKRFKDTVNEVREDRLYVIQ
jgi:translation initiation factor IF-2